MSLGAYQHEAQHGPAILCDAPPTSIEPVPTRPIPDDWRDLPTGPSKGRTILTSASLYIGVASTTLVRRLDQVASEWGVSRSEAVRRLLGASLDAWDEML